MIAMQTKNKLGKSLGAPEFTGPSGKKPQKVILYICETSFEP